MMSRMRSGLALVQALLLSILAITAAGCGGHGGSATTPQDRGRVRLVRCRAAPALPTLDAESRIYGGLLGTEAGGVGIGSIGVGPVGVLRVAPPGDGSGAAPAKPAMAVALGAPSITGALAPSVIMRVLQHRMTELTACAAKEEPLLLSGPSTSKAVVEWRFTVGATGKVIQADVTSHVLSPAIAACVTGVVRGSAFPAPSDGRVVAVTLPIAFDGTGAAPSAPEADAVMPWTPFALDATEAANITERAARAAEGAMRGRLAGIEACFASSQATGSLRAMLAVESDGTLASARVGGLGDKAIEACVENAVTGMRIMLPQETSGELACDLSRGDAQPWRVTPDRGGYGVVEISRTRVRHGDQTLSSAEDADTLTDHTMFLLVAEPDATGAMLGLAMKWTNDADATLVAVRAAKPPGAAPLLLGVGHTAATGKEGGDLDAVRATLEVGATTLTACASRWRHVAKLADPAALDGAAQKLAARCRTLACAPTLVVAVDRDAVAKDLVEVVGAARRAGLERVLFLRGAGGAAGPGGADDEDAADVGGCTVPRSDDE
jgi:hypothetical protein